MSSEEDSGGSTSVGAVIAAVLVLLMLALAALVVVALLCYRRRKRRKETARRRQAYATAAAHAGPGVSALPASSFASLSGGGPHSPPQSPPFTIGKTLFLSGSIYHHVVPMYWYMYIHLQ